MDFNLFIKPLYSLVKIFKLQITHRYSNYIEKELQVNIFSKLVCNINWLVNVKD